MAVLLLWERRKGRAGGSAVWGYVEQLPPSIDTPVRWGEGELAELQYQKAIDEVRAPSAPPLPLRPPARAAGAGVCVVVLEQLCARRVQLCLWRVQVPPGQEPLCRPQVQHLHTAERRCGSSRRRGRSSTSG